MTFPILVTLMLIAVIGILTVPFWRKSSTPAARSADADTSWSDLNIEKETLLRALADLEVDAAQGRVLDTDALRNDHTHRLATVLQQLDALAVVSPPQPSAVPPKESSWTVWGALLLLGGSVLGGATGLYKLVHARMERAQQAAAGNEVGEPKIPAVNPKEMVARLEARLQENPNDLTGQMMAGRSYMALERWEDAQRAWRKVIELDARSEVAHYNLAEALIRANPDGDPTRATEALTHLDLALLRTPQEPTILWARGIVLVQLGRTDEADAAWTAAYRAIPPDTTASDMVKQALETLRSGKSPFE